MESKGRLAYHDLIDARIAEWTKNIQNLEHRLAKKEDAEAREKLGLMKARLPQLTAKSAEAATVDDRAWPDFKSETDLILENLEWLQMYVMRRLGAG
jgi:hypothetical protein